MQQGLAVLPDAGDISHFDTGEEGFNPPSWDDGRAVGLMGFGGDLGECLGHRDPDGDSHPHLDTDGFPDEVGDAAVALAPEAAQPLKPHEALVDGVDLDLGAEASDGSSPRTKRSELAYVT